MSREDVVRTAVALVVLLALGTLLGLASALEHDWSWDELLLMFPASQD